MLPNAQRRRN